VLSQDEDHRGQAARDRGGRSIWVKRYDAVISGARLGRGFAKRQRPVKLFFNPFLQYCAAPSR